MTITVHPFSLTGGLDPRMVAMGWPRRHRGQRQLAVPADRYRP